MELLILSQKEIIKTYNLTISETNKIQKFSEITIPNTAFFICVNGLDEKEDVKVQRVQPSVIQPVTIQIAIGSTKGNLILSPNSILEVTLNVTNFGTNDVFYLTASTSNPLFRLDVSNVYVSVTNQQSKFVTVKCTADSQVKHGDTLQCCFTISHKRIR